MPAICGFFCAPAGRANVEVAGCCCSFHYVRFPDDERLVEIIQQFFSNPAPELVEKAVMRFSALRQEMTQDKAGKKVSTSELIDWFNILSRYPKDEIIKKLDGKLPFPGLLLKSWEDHKRYLAGMGDKV